MVSKLRLSLKTISEFVNLESISGLLLFSAAILALILANLPGQTLYPHIVSFIFSLKLNGDIYSASLQAIVNNGLMTIFFLLVGLEIKHEIFHGNLNSLSKVMLPGIAALGGMVVPALFFYFINAHHAVYIRGWAIPTATDIAFALGVLLLLGERIPISLKVFLTALAIFDDIGAILIIAFFYNSNIDWIALISAFCCFIILMILNHRKVSFLPMYLILGFFLWLSIFYSGVHPTIAGVLLAITIPIGTDKNGPLYRLEKKLHPWVAFLVLPLFGFLNAGISLSFVTANLLLSPLTLGIIIGLFLGKQVGVFGATWFAIKLKLAKLPPHSSLYLIYGMSIICGVGFTMSLFIGALAFDDQNNPDLMAKVRLGILLASFLSGFVGYLILRFQPSKKYLIKE